MNLIVAYCKNRGIGMLNKIPWRLPGDIARFKKLTVGKGNNAVIMGKNTWCSIPDEHKPLPKRQNIVLASKISQSPTCPVIFGSLEGAKEYCDKSNFDSVWVIGGEFLYKEALQKGMIDWMYTTEIDNDYTCDTFFQEIPPTFTLYSTTPWQTDNGIRFRYNVYNCSE